MKRLILLACLIFAPAMGYAAHAAIIFISDVGTSTDAPAPTVVRWNFIAVYQGGDVSGTIQKASLTVQVSSTTTLVQLSAAMVASVQAEAVNRGFTVPVGNTFVPNYTAQ